MTIKIGDHNYDLLVASDTTTRDGMGIEVYEETNGHHGALLVEVFYSDMDNGMTFTSHRHDLPFELIEYLASMARPRLTPKKFCAQSHEALTMKVDTAE